jgi:hypothetical protein
MIVKSMKVTPIGQIVSNQDGAIWGKYLFAINGRGHVRVYDIDSFKGGITPDGNIDSFVLDKADVICPHSNAVCFGSEFYCEGDEFPLLYTNIYNNYAGAPDPLKGVCCVYRIVRDGKKFSSALVQLIEIGFVEDATLWKMSEDADCERPYGNFVIDRDKNIFYGFTMRSAKSGTRYFAFDLPRVQGGETSKAYGVKRVVLGRDDIKYYFDTEQHYYPQGACCHNSLIYSLEGFNTDELPPRLRIIDAEAKKQIFCADLRKYIPGIEPELIDFCGDTCYYADDEGNLYIMELELAEDGE